MLDQVTPLIITYNEAPNIGRTLSKLDWAKNIIVIDSGSTDGTQEIVGSCPRAVLVHRAFEDFASQCNFGLTQVTTPWVLSLDADYELSDELVEELHALAPPGQIMGYRARFVYRIYGKPLRGTLYPPRIVLYRKAEAFYQNEGHGHRVSLSGRVAEFHGRIYHDDRKPLTRWLTSQNRYAAEEAEYLLQSNRIGLTLTDRIRRMGWPAPISMFFFVLLGKGCILDGWRGWYYVLQRVVAETLIALELVDRRLRGKK